MDKKLRIFTTRPDTIFGASFVTVISVDHEICSNFLKMILTLKNLKKNVQKLEPPKKLLANADKLGFNTNMFVDHPFIKEKITIYVANFVLMDYGNGAIFGCPAHDQKDFDFARKYNLQIVRVVSDNQNTKTDDQMKERLPAMVR